MKKFIIVYNFERMPENCMECPLHDGNGYPMCTSIERSHGSLAYYFNGDKERNPYCPLRPMPNELEIDFVDNPDSLVWYEYYLGYNACIRVIEELENEIITSD